jgi:predicted  nucleic acid-binding Zn-ribbon protein
MVYDNLYDLSVIDCEILKLQKALHQKEKVVELNEIKKNYEQLKIEYDKNAEDASAIAKDAAILNEQLNKLTGDLKDNEYKLYNTSSMKTIDACQRTIDKIKNDIKITEEKLYKLMEEEENIKKQKNEIILQSKAVKEKYNSLREEYFNEQNNLNNKLEQLNQSRSKAASCIDIDILKPYEEVKAKKGYGMCELKNEICTGCGYDVSLQVVDEVKTKKSLVKCPNCGRYLYLNK